MSIPIPQSELWARKHNKHLTWRQLAQQLREETGDSSITYDMVRSYVRRYVDRSHLPLETNSNNPHIDGIDLAALRTECVKGGGR